MKPKNNKETPYQELYRYLFSDNNDMELSIGTIKGLTQNGIIKMFSNLDDITIWFNEYFNNFYTYELDKRELYKFAKDIVSKFRIKKKQLSYIKFHSKDKTFDVLHKQFPYLKRYELPLFSSLLESDDEYDEIMDALGLKKYKKSRVKKTTKKKKETIVKKEDKPILKKEIITIQDWTDNFVVI